MRRKNRARILFRLKVLAICGAAVFMIKGVGEFYAVAESNSGKGETEEIKTMEERVTAEASSVDIEENKVAEIQCAEAVIEHQSDIYSMDWDSEDAYLLEKIAMAEAESEGVEGKALVMLVVLNRVHSDGFPDTIKEVIYQRTGNGGWQFSPLQEGGRWYTTEPDQECREALELIQIEKWDESQGALYFESAGRSDWHRNNLEFLFQYGKHYFYTDKELTE